MTFKEQLIEDNINVFMNVEEFTDIHTINGVEMPVLIDNNELVDREKRYQYKHSLYADGVYLTEILIYVHANDFGPLPAIGRRVVFDNKSYTITDAINEDGIYSLTLGANRTGASRP